jgi:hypothetical protein
MRTYYIYRHIRHDKNTPFYIGKGTVTDNCVTHDVIYRRAYSNLGRNKIWHGITSRTGYDVEIIYATNDRKEIDKKEIEFIKLYGRIDIGTGTLCNLTSGGDGQYEVTSEALKKGVEKRIMNGTYLSVGLKNSRPVHTYDKDGKYLKSYISKRECAKDLMIDVSIVFTGIKQKRMFANVFFSNEKTSNIDLSCYTASKFTRKRIMK